MTVSLPEVPVLGVLLNGPACARRRTVDRDSDGLPVRVLGEKLRWPAVERACLPAWLAEPYAVVGRLITSTTPRLAPSCLTDQPPY